jgi:hypothetical protein
MTASQKQKSGQCRCGDITFVAKGPSMLTMACHCKGCQRMTGSAFSLSAMYADANFEVFTGTPAIGGMKASPAHYVCPKCSSWIFTRVASPMGDLVNVRAPMFDEPDQTTPFIETCTLEKLDWVSLGAKHSFDKFPSGEQFGALLGEFKEIAT